MYFITYTKDYVSIKDTFKNETYSSDRKEYFRIEISKNNSVINIYSTKYGNTPGELIITGSYNQFNINGITYLNIETAFSDLLTAFFFRG